MRAPLNRNFFKTGVILFFLALVFFAGISPVNAFQKKADTVSSADVQFTSIPTAADSAAIRKKHADSVRKAQAPVLKNGAQDDSPKTLWGIFIAGFLGGFAAFLMPCIYPMLPLTVSFFTKKGGSQSKAVVQSLLYGLSIIVIYVILGIIISLIFGPLALNALATNGVFNFVFFLLLVVFAASFFGAFEITLPGTLANKLDQNSEKGGLTGLFFMAATLAVVSFSCTGPIIGTEIVAAATKGERIGPIISMLGFSMALALPFTLFALFPSALKSLPKSGNWLNSVKVILGFIELAFSLKFLSNVDLAYHWDWFDREIFLSLWIAIGLLLGLYLIGKIKIGYESELASLSVPRIFLSVITFAFVIYMVPGLWGAPLNSISAFLPGLSTQDFVLSGDSHQVETGKKYADLFQRLPKVKGIDDWYDYDQAMALAKKEHKPLFIDFTGWNCANCRKMETNVFPNPDVLKRLQDNFIVVQLVIDDKTELPPADQSISSYDGKKITTLGAKWLDFEITKFNSNAQPNYCIVDQNGNAVIPPQGGVISLDGFIKYLDDAVAAYKSEQ